MSARSTDGDAPARARDRLLILADDLTGACDAACGFASAGERVVVMFGAPERWPEDVDVLAIDLDVRERAAADARAAMADAIAALREPGLDAGAIAPSVDTPADLRRGQPRRLFVKIDSTLRGPIAALVDGALATSGMAVAVVAPAFPDQGRLLEDGRLRTAGGIGPSLVEALGFERTALISARGLGSPDQADAAIEHARMRGARRVALDTDSTVCLESVAAAWAGHPEWLLVGSAGLARALAGPARVSFDAAGDGDGGGPLLVIAASPADATRAQLHQLSALAHVTTVVAAQPVSPHPRTHAIVALCSAPIEGNPRDAGQAACAVAEAACAWTRAMQPAPRALVLAGGATARGVCQKLGARGLRLEAELEPGVAVGRLLGGEFDGMRVVTKAGGFGGPTTLVDVAAALGVSSARGKQA